MDTPKDSLELGVVLTHIFITHPSLSSYELYRSLKYVVLTLFFLFCRHQGSFHIGHITDSTGNTFATRLNNVFTIGKGSRPWVSLPRGKGVKLSILEQKEVRGQN